MNEKRFFTTLAKDEYTLIQKKGNPRSTYLKYNEVVDLLNKLYEENEQLRQQHQRLYNYFRDYLEDEMSAENFGEMWDTVKVDERWNDE